MNKLPKVFANHIDSDINNVQKVYKDNYVRLNYINPQNINKKIDEIFASSNHIYKSRVRIKFKDHEEECYIVGKTNTNLLLLDGKLIKITDILDIEKI